MLGGVKNLWCRWRCRTRFHMHNCTMHLCSGRTVGFRYSLLSHTHMIMCSIALRMNICYELRTNNGKLNLLKVFENYRIQSNRILLMRISIFSRAPSHHTQKKWMVFPQTDCILLFHSKKNGFFSFHFSFDVRGRQFGQAKLWSSPTVFGSRAFFSTANSPAQLKVDNIQLADEAVYRCRVDFRNSPTRNLKINLTVIGKCTCSNSIYYSWNSFRDFKSKSNQSHRFTIRNVQSHSTERINSLKENVSQPIYVHKGKLTFLHKFECDSHVVLAVKRKARKKK